nr:immunoglobulin light chain junction region [Macaca mulatta]
WSTWDSSLSTLF